MDGAVASLHPLQLVKDTYYLFPYIILVAQLLHHKTIERTRDRKHLRLLGGRWAGRNRLRDSSGMLIKAGCIQTLFSGIWDMIPGSESAHFAVVVITHLLALYTKKSKNQVTHCMYTQAYHTL